MKKTIITILLLGVFLELGYCIEPFIFDDENKPAVASPDLSSSHAFTPIPRENLEPFLKKYCVECHGPKKQKGQVRFDTIDWNITNNDTAQRWQDVLDQLNGGDMPPEEADQPQKKEMVTVLSSLTKNIQTARHRLTDHGGEIKMRRLNQREYSNTIYHLLGFDVPLAEIPEDGEIVSFDTVGDEQFFTTNHFNKYLKLSRKIMQEAFRHSIHRRQNSGPIRVQPEKGVVEGIAKGRAKLAEEEKQLAEGKTWQEMGFADEGAFKYWHDMRGRHKMWWDRTMARPKVASGLYLSPDSPVPTSADTLIFVLNISYASAAELSVILYRCAESL